MAIIGQTGKTGWSVPLASVLLFCGELLMRAARLQKALTPVGKFGTIHLLSSSGLGC